MRRVSPSSQPAPPSCATSVGGVGGAEQAVDADQLGLELAAADPGPGIAARAGDGAAAQGPVDVDRAAGQDLGAGGDRAHHRHVALGVIDRLAGAQGSLEDEGIRLARLRRLDGLRRRLGLRDLGLRHLGRAAAAQERRQRRAEPGRLGLLDTHDADAALLEFVDEAGDVGRRRRGIGVALGGVGRLGTGRISPEGVLGQARDVQNHGALGEERRRALHQGIQVREPVAERRLRREHERPEGAAAQREGGAGEADAGHGG